MSTQQHPAAWAVFADNGNVRLWSTDHAEVRDFAERIGQPLIALNPGPPAQPAPHDDPIGNACRLLRDAAQEYAECVSVNGVPDWKNEPDTHSAYIEHITAAHRLEQWAASIGAGGVEPLRRRECLHQIAEPAPIARNAAERDALLQAAIDFIGTLTGMTPPPIEVAPPEVFAPFRSFVDRVQAITMEYSQTAPASVAGPSDPSLDLIHAMESAWHDISHDSSITTEAKWLRFYRRVFAAAPTTQAEPVAQEALDAAFEAVRHRLCELQRYSFVLDDDGVVRRVQDRTGNWIEFDDAHALFDPVAVDAARAKAKEGGAA